MKTAHKKACPSLRFAIHRPSPENVNPGGHMSTDEAIAVVRRNTEEVQDKGNYEVFEELFAKDFVDHTPQPGGFSADRDGARNLYRVLRTAFPDFHAEIHWQISDGDALLEQPNHARKFIRPGNRDADRRAWMTS